MENEDVMCDGEIELSDRAKSLWGKTNRVDDTEWLPLYVHMADSAAMAARIWDTWVPYGTKSIISRDLGNDDDLARKLMIFLAGVHDIGKATPVSGETHFIRSRCGKPCLEAGASRASYDCGT